ncbi:MAG: peptidyl-alpha-hydroxyglycine alpha-amidating lyase family protein [Planctomycetaceae bacterium]
MNSFRPLSARTVLQCLAATGLALSIPGALHADSPNHATEQNLVEYDHDPGWPKRPENVKPWGWVSGIAVDAQNQVWLFNKGPDPVQVYAADGTFVRTWGKDKFLEPHQLRIDREGNVWVADFGLHVVQKYTPEGKLLQELGVRGESGEDNLHFNKPTDMAITKSGDIFVTDGYGNRRIVHFDKDGHFVKAWGTFGSKPGEFVLPHAIHLDSQELLYVCDRNSGRIQVFDQQGKFRDQWENIIMPWGITINARDEVWICGSSPHWWFRLPKYKDIQNGYPEYKDQLLMRFSTDGRLRQVWGLPLGADKNVQPGETRGVHCIAQDSKGNLYVGDIYGERAQKFVPVSSPPASEQKPATK